MAKRKRYHPGRNEGFGIGDTLAQLKRETQPENATSTDRADDEGWTKVGAPKKRRIHHSAHEVSILSMGSRSRVDGHDCAAKSANGSPPPDNGNSEPTSDPETATACSVFNPFSESSDGIGRESETPINPFSASPTNGTASKEDKEDTPNTSHTALESSEKQRKQEKLERGKARKLERHPPDIYHARLNSQVKITDLQSLILYILADAPAPQWVAVSNRAEMRQVVVLMVPGLDLSMFTENSLLKTSNPAETSSTEDAKRPKRSGISPDDYYPTALKRDRLPDALKPLADMFLHVYPVAGTADKRGANQYQKLHSPISTILTSQIPKTKEEKKLKKHHKGPLPQKAGHWENKRTPIAEYVANLTQQVENQYVIHPAWFITPAAKEGESKRREVTGRTSANGWVDSAVASLEDGKVPDKDIEQGSVTGGRKILAIDCEMVLSERGEHLLAKITVLNWHGEVVLDELIKPNEPIKDYLSQYSGITEKMLKDVTTTLPDIQKRLLEMLTPQTIVVGHSLDSDLKALKLTHPFIVDSAILYPHVMGLPRKNGLQWLSKKYLNREIQKGTTGHDSAEDARAALDLVKLKCERGPGFGTYETNAESIFTRLGRTVHPRSPDCTRAGAVVDWGYPNRGHGSRAQVVIPCKSDQDVVEGIELAVKGLAVGETGAPRDVDFVWGRLRELELARGWWDDTKSPDVEEIRLAALKRLGRAGSDEETEITGEELLAVVSRTVEHIAKIYESLPRGTAFIVYSGTGDPREMRRLQAMNRQYHEEYRTKKWDDLSVQWTDREVQALSQAVNNARQGISFVTVK